MWSIWPSVPRRWLPDYGTAHRHAGRPAMRVSPYGTGSSGTASIRMTRCGGGSEDGGRPVGSIQSRTCRSGCGQSGTDTVRSVRLATRLIGDFASARGMGWLRQAKSGASACVLRSKTWVCCRGRSPKGSPFVSIGRAAVWSACEAVLRLSQEAPVFSDLQRCIRRKAVALPGNPD